ncbi:MAG: PadR family transcriptional regulator [Candidatus Micrarchaeia archaeon]
MVKSEGRAVKITALMGSGIRHKKMNMLTQFLLWRLAMEPAHGYHIMRDLREFKMASFQQSTIYAVLSQMEKGGLIRSRIAKDGARIRKVYYTTAKGIASFERNRKTRIKGIIKQFLRALSA